MNSPIGVAPSQGKMVSGTQISAIGDQYNQYVTGGQAKRGRKSMSYHWAWGQYCIARQADRILKRDTLIIPPDKGD